MSCNGRKSANWASAGARPRSSKSGPITFIGSGENLNVAVENGLQRAASVTGLPYDEVLNRATITGSIDISRLPGTVRVTFLCPMDVFDRIGIGHLVREKYDPGVTPTGGSVPKCVQSRRRFNRCEFLPEQQHRPDTRFRLTVITLLTNL